mmetsp:Transcript_135457/g.235573  ORF Transcript_135457/g.235573 Transcript_135457/m.235573 type:complete len:192 (+) Transcript_135457:114-689(+)
MPYGEYGSGSDYWNARYTEKPETHEWLISNPKFNDSQYLELRSIVEEVSGGSQACKILHVGCGNSALPERLYDDGYHNILNIDTSDVVISQMQQRNEARPEMTWAVIDALDTAYDEASFDIVIDKSLLDTFACIKGGATETVASYLKEMIRVLRPGGALVCVSLAERGKFLGKSELEYELRGPRNTHIVRK